MSAARTPPSASGTDRRVRASLANVLRDDVIHVVCCRDDLRVHLVGPLCRYELRDLLDGIDIGILEITLLDRRVTGIAGVADDRVARCHSFAKQVAAER